MKRKAQLHFEWEIGDVKSLKANKLIFAGGKIRIHK